MIAAASRNIYAKDCSIGCNLGMMSVCGRLVTDLAQSFKPHSQKSVSLHLHQAYTDAASHVVCASAALQMYGPFPTRTDLAQLAASPHGLKHLGACVNLSIASATYDGIKLTRRFLTAALQDRERGDWTRTWQNGKELAFIEASKLGCRRGMPS